jgi:hypothetical protein
MNPDFGEEYEKCKTFLNIVVIENLNAERLKHMSSAGF